MGEGEFFLPYGIQNRSDPGQGRGAVPTRSESVELPG